MSEGYFDSGRNGMTPNVLLITADQLRYDALGCNGNGEVFTPNLDRLAERGVRFDRAYTPDPICVPARASLTTGCYPHKCLGFKQNDGAIREGFPLIAREFAERGYETYAMGKLHYLPYAFPRERRTLHGFSKAELAESGRMVQQFDPSGNTLGIEDYHDHLKRVGWGGYARANCLGNNDVFPGVSLIPAEHQVDAWVADRTMAHLDAHLASGSGKPFFMWTSFPKPHSAYDPPRPYDAFYDPRALRAPVGSIDDIRERGLEFLYKDYIDFGWNVISPEAKQAIKAFYYGLVTFQDAQVGRIIQFLEKYDLMRDTIVVFTTDHGDMLGDFDLYFKRVFYEASARIPLIMVWEGRLPCGKTSGALCGLQDLLPTLMNLIDSPIQAAVDGIDLSPALFGETRVRDRYIAQCNDSPEQQYMILEGSRKYIYHENGGVEELYDLDEDPRELTNITAPESCRGYREQLIEWCRAEGDGSMLSGDALKKAPRGRHLERKPQWLPFGRRFY